MKSRYIAWVLRLAALVLTLQPQFVPGAAPRFEVPSVSGTGIQLRLTGEANRRYQIEWSTNLTQWTTLASGVAAGGVLSAQDGLASGSASRFYRGRLEEALPPFPTVSASVQSNRVGTGVAYADAVGRVELGTFEGTRFVLQIPTNAFAQTTTVRMILITNLTGVPATRGFLAGVRLEPSGAVLASPAFLEIQFPTNIPASQVSSYGFDNDGTDLHLVPDVVLTNRVKILVNQLRSYGCGVFTLEEVQAMAATAPPPRARRGRLSLHATMEECYPEDEAAAAEMREELEDAIRPLQQEIAEKLGIERQKQLLGIVDEGEGNTAILEALNTGANFYETELRPRVAEASRRCATTRELLPWMLGWERQRQLLGAVSDDEPPDPEINNLMCQGVKRCEEQAIECCRTRGGDTRLIAFLLGIERQRQLLGMTEGSCGTSPGYEDLIGDCAPKWFGTLKVSETGSFSTNRSSASVINRTRVQWDFSYEATVETVEVNIIDEALFLPSHTNLTFRLAGRLNGSHAIDEQVTDLWDPCEGSQRALAGRRPHDGGEARDYHAIVNSSTNGVFSTELSATILAPGTGGFGVTPRLRFSVPSAAAPWTGWIKDVMKVVDGFGCSTEDRSGPPSGTDFFGGMTFNRGSGEFQYTADSIRFLRITPRVDGQMLILQRVELELKRIK